MRVWVEDWQMQCCGDPFTVGSDVEWDVEDNTDSGWFDRIMGTALTPPITHVEEHHVSEDLAQIRGKVRRIQALTCTFAASRHRAQTLVAVTGSGQLHEVDTADGWFKSDDRFVGYVVDLDVP